MTLEMLETLWCVFANVRPWVAGPAHPVFFVIPSRSRTRLIDPRDTIPPTRDENFSVWRRHVASRRNSETLKNRDDEQILELKKGHSSRVN